MTWSQATTEGLVLLLHCQPGAKVSRVVGVHDHRLKLQLQAPPLENRANDALIGWLSKQLNISRKHIEILSGQTSRKKRVLVKGATAEQALKLIESSRD